MEEVSLQDVQDAARFLQAFLEAKDPTVDWTPGSPDHQIVIKGNAYPYALLKKAVETVRNGNTLLGLRNLPETEDVADMADAILSNLLVSRASGKFSRGVALCRMSRRVDVRVPRATRFFKTAALVYYPDYADDFVVPSTELRPVRGADNALLYYTFPINLKAARVGAAYDQDVGLFETVDTFSPYVLGAENLTEFKGGKDVQSTNDLIDTAADAMSSRVLGSSRSNSVVLRQTFNVDQVLTVGHGDAEMVRDVLSSSIGQIHLGGCADLYVRVSPRETVSRKTIGGSALRPDNRAVVFRDPTPPGALPFTDPSVDVRVGDILSIRSGLPESPVQYKVTGVRDYELDISVRTPFSSATAEATSPPALGYSVGNNYPLFDNKVTTGGATSSSATTTRSISAKNRVTLDGGPVYAIKRVELLAPVPAALNRFKDPVTGRVPFTVRVNVPLSAPASTDVDLPFKVEVVNPNESQSSRAITQLEVGWPGIDLGGSQLEVTYDTVSGFDTIAAYVVNPDNRPDPADYLVRAFHPVYVSFSVPYALRTDTSPAARIGRLLVPTGTFDPSRAVTGTVQYIESYRSADPMDVSGLVSQLRLTNDVALAALYTFEVNYELLAPDGKVYRYRTADKITLFPTATNGARLLNPTEVGLPTTGYYDALRKNLRALGVSDRAVRFLVASGAVTFEARA